MSAEKKLLVGIFTISAYSHCKQSYLPQAHCFGQNCEGVCPTWYNRAHTCNNALFSHIISLPYIQTVAHEYGDRVRIPSAQ